MLLLNLTWRFFFTSSNKFFNRLKVKLTAETRGVIFLSPQAVGTSMDCWFISLLALPPAVLLSGVIVKTIWWVSPTSVRTAKVLNISSEWGLKLKFGAHLQIVVYMCSYIAVLFSWLSIRALFLLQEIHRLFHLCEDSVLWILDDYDVFGLCTLQWVYGVWKGIVLTPIRLGDHSVSVSFSSFVLYGGHPGATVPHP